MSTSRRRRGAIALGVAVGLLAGGPAASAAGRHGHHSLAVAVSGRHLVDDAGRPLHLDGVSFPGADTACTDGPRTWDAPATADTADAMRAWGVTTVRLPLNEDCWLGINGLPLRGSASRYRSDVSGFVRLLHRHGMRVILTLRAWAPGFEQSTQPGPMADADHAPAFWTSVAGAFRRDRAVLFDLVAQPHGVSWDCWSTGCVQDGVRYTGMEQLLRAVREAGARQPVIADGLDFADDVSQWTDYAPADPAHALAAGFSTYGDRACSTPSCWSRTVGRLASSVPVVTTELGELDCRHDLVDRYTAWAERAGVSWLAWAWSRADCAGGPSLLAADGSPSGYGTGIRTALLRRHGSPDTRPGRVPRHLT